MHKKQYRPVQMYIYNMQRVNQDFRVSKEPFIYLPILNHKKVFFQVLNNFQILFYFDVTFLQVIVKHKLDLMDLYLNEIIDLIFSDNFSIYSKGPYNGLFPKMLKNTCKLAV